MGKEDEQTIIAQAEFEGNPFHRRTDPRLGGLTTQPRKVRIIGALNETTGQIVFRGVTRLPPGVHPSDFSHLTLQDGNLIDLAQVGQPSLKTERKRGSSTAGVDMDQVWRSRGGDPDYRPPKTGGFRLKLGT